MLPATAEEPAGLLLTQPLAGEASLPSQQWTGMRKGQSRPTRVDPDHSTLAAPWTKLSRYQLQFQGVVADGPSLFSASGGKRMCTEPTGSHPAEPCCSGWQHSISQELVRIQVHGPLPRPAQQDSVQWGPGTCVVTLSLLRLEKHHSRE